MHEVARGFLFVSTLLLLWLCLTFSLSCLNLLGMALWPSKPRAARALLGQSLARCLLVGLSFMLGTLLLLVVSKHNPGTGILALPLLAFLAWQLLGSLPGLAGYVGESLWPGANPTRATVLGTVVICAGGAFPWVGWAILVVLLAACAGSGILATLKGLRAQSRKPAPPVEERAPISQA